MFFYAAKVATQNFIHRLSQIKSEKTTRKVNFEKILMLNQALKDFKNTGMNISQIIIK